MCRKVFGKGGIGLSGLFPLIYETETRLDFGKISGAGIWCCSKIFPRLILQ